MKTIIFITIFLSCIFGCSKNQEINLVSKESEKIIFLDKKLHSTIGGNQETINFLHLDVLMKVLDLVDSEENINFGITVCEIFSAAKGHPNNYFNTEQLEATKRFEKLLSKVHFEKALNFLEKAKTLSRNKNSKSWQSAITDLERRLINSKKH